MNNFALNWDEWDTMSNDKKVAKLQEVSKMIEKAEKIIQEVIYLETDGPAQEWDQKEKKDEDKTQSPGKDSWENHIWGWDELSTSTLVNQDDCSIQWDEEPIEWDNNNGW